MITDTYHFSMGEQVFHMLFPSSQGVRFDRLWNVSFFMIQYRASFTAGALMREESVRIAEELLRGIPPDLVNPDVLDTNSEQGRQRKTSEILRRFEQTDRSTWSDLPVIPVAQQQVILYYSCMKTYRLLFDFHMDVVLPRWRSLDRELTPYDAQRFLERRADEHPEIDEWTEKTWEKVRQVMLKMLTEARLLQENRLQPVQLPNHFWERFVKVGDLWFLEAVFLNESQRQATVQAVIA